MMLESSRSNSSASSYLRGPALWILIGFPLGFFAGITFDNMFGSGNAVTAVAPIDTRATKTGDGVDHNFDGVKARMINSVPAWVIGNTPQATKKQVITSGCNPQAQNAEDLTAYHNFFHNRAPGIILESGAFDPVSISTSYMYETCLDWRSIHIEPSPGKYAKFVGQRPNALNINAAICSKPRAVHFRDDTGVGGIVEFMGDQHVKQYFGSRESAIETSTRITCLPLMDLLRLYNVKHIDLWILDVENAELEILSGMDFNAVTIDVIVIEDAQNQRNDFLKYLSGTHNLHGWRNPNLYFVRKGFTGTAGPQQNEYAITAPP